MQLDAPVELSATAVELTVKVCPLNVSVRAWPVPGSWLSCSSDSPRSRSWSSGYFVLPFATASTAALALPHARTRLATIRITLEIAFKIASVELFRRSIHYILL